MGCHGFQCIGRFSRILLSVGRRTATGDAAGNGHVTVPCLEGSASLMDADQTGGAGGINDNGRAAEIENIADTACQNAVPRACGAEGIVLGDALVELRVVVILAYEDTDGASHDLIQAVAAVFNGGTGRF